MRDKNHYDLMSSWTSLSGPRAITGRFGICCRTPSASLVSLVNARGPSHSQGFLELADADVDETEQMRVLLIFRYSNSFIIAVKDTIIPKGGLRISLPAQTFTSNLTPGK